MASHTNPFELLKEDHRKVEHLFESFFTQKDPKQKQLMLNQLIKELSIHAEIEEEYLYPLVRDSMGSGTADRALHEHQEVKEILKELDDFSGNLKGEVSHWPAFPENRVELLRKNVMMHVQEEEQQIMPQIQSRLQPKQLDTLTDNLIRAKRTAPSRPHPSAPNKPPFNKMAAPGAAAVDKMRDLGREFPAEE